MIFCKKEKSDGLRVSGASSAFLSLFQGCSLFSEKTAKFWIYVPVFFLFLGGVFCPFSGFPSSTLTVVGSFRENGQVLD